ncbi:MAG: hypothetical protein DMG97_09285 [Acidobacteria bacterium]|nr:MAG: hypothetical protein DMG97_09285 [Acidobacteriota bacterium]
MGLGIKLSELNVGFMVKPELLEAYKRTQFIVDLPDRQTIICHGQRNGVIEQILAEHAAKTGAFITAHNPRSQRLSDAENRERHRLLIADVKKQGFAYLTGSGIGEDHGWPAEESLLVIGTTHDQAIALGTKHGQLAIVWVETGKAAQIVLC